MPRYRRHIEPVAAGAPPVDSIESGLSLLLFLSDPKAQKTAKAMLESLQTAVKANKELLAAFGPANKIVDLEADAEADRAAAAQELADAKAEAKVIITDANGKAEGRIAILNERDADISARERSVVDHEQALSDKEAAFERETAGLRKALG